MSTQQARSNDQHEQQRAFCPECMCGFPGWVKKCPICSVPLQAEPTPIPPIPTSVLPYGELVSLVKEQGGTLKVHMRTVEVARARHWGVPYMGYGFTWAKRIQGEVADCPITLWTRDVGMDKARAFPYKGYGFAWARGVAGHIAGNPTTLGTDQVEMKKEWGFPYFGFGFAWAQEMSGQCGDHLRVRFSASDVTTEKKWRFPCFGFGFAWVAAGDLTIDLRQ